MTSGHGSLRFDEQADLDPAQLSRAGEHDYASERQSTRGCFSKPATQTASALPLVVLPDDGPNGRTEWRFSFLRHFLLSRGYAVLTLVQ